MGGAVDKQVLLVAKGTFEALGGAERDLMRVLPALNELFSVRMATIHPVLELREICDRDGIRMICPDHPWKLPKGSLSTVLDTGRSTASKAWSSCHGLDEALSEADALHLVSGDGSLPLMDHVPIGLRTHLHLLEPHRGLYEEPSTGW